MLSVTASGHQGNFGEPNEDDGGQIMKIQSIIVIATVCLLTACTSPQNEQAGGMAKTEDMTGEELQALLANGLTLTLGGAGEGYAGKLRLEPDGTGVGEAILDDGRKLDTSGTWIVKGDQFCREWKYDNFKNTCETWRILGSNRAEVMVDGKRIGLNSW
jgi:hypothetical protein